MLTFSTELLLISKSASRRKGLKERQISKQNPASRPIQAKISNFFAKKPNVTHFATIWHFKLFWNWFLSRFNLEMKKKWIVGSHCKLLHWSVCAFLFQRISRHCYYCNHDYCNGSVNMDQLNNHSIVLFTSYLLYRISSTD